MDSLSAIDANAIDEDNDRNDQQYSQVYIQSRLPSDISTTTDDHEVNDYSQQLRDKMVIVNLYDCMQCYIKLERCKVIAVR